MEASQAVSRVFDSSQVRFGELIRTLTSAACQPTSQTMRNHLLAGVTSRRDPTQRLPNDGGDDDWGTLKDQQPGFQAALFGHVPESLLRRDLAETGSVAGRSDSTAGVWGVALLVSSKLRDEVEPETFLRRPNLSIWLSTESDLARQRTEAFLADGGEDALRRPIALDAASQGILEQMVRDWLPVAYQSFIHAQAAQRNFGSGVIESHLRYVDVIIQALDQSFLCALLQIAEAGGAQDGASPTGLTVDWHASFQAFAMADHDKPLDTDQESELAGPRWQVGPLTDVTVETVRAANHLPFPRQHILRKPFLSVAVRDVVGPPSSQSGDAVRPDGETLSSTDYPQQQHAGALAGWCYTHEDLSLASLHVAEPYRRLTSPQVSLGRLIVQLLTRRIAESQRRALSRFRMDLDELRKQEASTGWCAWHTKADVDVTSEGAIRFYQRCGFKLMAIHAWVGLRAPI
ncbi:unnamed protein product [Parajaminaea phylloscopi]